MPSCRRILLWQIFLRDTTTTFVYVSYDSLAFLWFFWNMFFQDGVASNTAVHRFRWQQYRCWILCLFQFDYRKIWLYHAQQTSLKWDSHIRHWWVYNRNTVFLKFRTEVAYENGILKIWTASNFRMSFWNILTYCDISLLEFSWRHYELEQWMQLALEVQVHDFSCPSQRRPRS